MGIAAPQLRDTDNDQCMQTPKPMKVPVQALSPPFLLLEQIWVENSDGSGAVNFLTGMGGFLQAILFGYTGFR